MKYKNISIIGSKKFVKHTIEALDLIKNKSKIDFNRVNKYLKKIKQAKQSEMVLDKAQFSVANPTAFHSVEWYAGTIVHDTYHYILHSTGKLLWKKGNREKHERLCTEEEIRFFKKIKAPKYLIKHCRETLKLKYWTKSYKKSNPKW